ncbi:MAG: sulfotransferase, partial [Solirubrobacterales bacterium]|nr:sulfotransferase [Solirubrobacterales bacterium]
MSPRALLSRRRHRAVDASFDERVVWLLGSPRSGSTWLLYLLAEHRAILPVNEPLIGFYLGPFMSDLPAMSAKDMDLDNFTLRRVHREKRPHFFAEEFADVWLPGLARMLRERFHAQAVRHPVGVPLEETFVVVKEPNGSQSADVLMRAMPGSRLLFLLRDGRDVVDSELAANVKGSWVAGQFEGSSGVGEGQRLDFVVQSARKWVWRTQVVREAYAAHDGPKLMLRYEDLRADPFAQLSVLFAWLGLDVGDG